MIYDLTEWLRVDDIIHFAILHIAICHVIVIMGGRGVGDGILLCIPQTKINITLRCLDLKKYANVD